MRRPRSKRGPPDIAVWLVHALQVRLPPAEDLPLLLFAKAFCVTSTKIGKCWPTFGEKIARLFSPKFFARCPVSNASKGTRAPALRRWRTHFGSSGFRSSFNVKFEWRNKQTAAWDELPNEDPQIQVRFLVRPVGLYGLIPEKLKLLI